MFNSSFFFKVFLHLIYNENHHKNLKLLKITRKLARGFKIILAILRSILSDNGSLSTGSKKSQLKIHDHGHWHKQDHGSRVFVIQKTLDQKIMYDLMGSGRLAVMAKHVTVVTQKKTLYGTYSNLIRTLF